MMHPSVWRRLVTLASLALIVAALLPTGGVPAALAADDTQGVTGLGASRDVVTPLHAVLSLDRLPPIGKPATMTCRVTADEAAPGTTIQIELPSNACRADGDLAWQGDLAAGQSISVSTTVVFDAGGDTTLLCRTLRQIDAKNSWGDLAALYLSVGATATQEGFAPVPPAERIQLAGLLRAGDGTLIPEDQVNSVPRPDDAQVEAPPALTPHAPPAKPALAPAPAQPASPKDQSVKAQAQDRTAEPPAQIGPAPQVPAQQPEAPEGNLTVTGNWAYYDRNDNLVGALEMLVELVRGDNNGHLAYCFTDLDGNYSCGPVTNPGGVGVRTLLRSWTNYNPNGDILAVVNPDYGTSNAINFTYPTQTGIVVFPDGTHNIGAWQVNNNSTYERAYWTQRDLNETWRYIILQRRRRRGRSDHRAVEDR